MTPQMQDLFQQTFDEYRRLPDMNFDFLTPAQCRQRFPSQTDVCGNCQQKVVINRKAHDRRPLGSGIPPPPLTMNLGEDCHDLATYIHEFGHFFGLLHELQHPDRQVIILRDQLGMAIDQVAVLDLSAARREQLCINYGMSSRLSNWNTTFIRSCIMTVLNFASPVLSTRTAVPQNDGAISWKKRRQTIVLFRESSTAPRKFGLLSRACPLATRPHFGKFTNLTTTTSYRETRLSTNTDRC